MAPTALAIDKVSIQLRWDNQFQFAGYYAAKWQGYYAQKGIETEILSAVPSPTKILSAIEEVSEGRADFGIGSADILIGREKGASLIVLASIFQTSASAFYSLKKTPVNNLGSLRDLKVARRPNDLIDIEFQAMLRAEGIDPANIKAYPHETGIDHLTSGRVDVIPGYRISVPFNTAKSGVQLAELLPSRYGVDFYGDSLFTHANLVQRNPDLVSRFVAASLKGWEYALEHPEEIAHRIARELPRNSPVDDNDLLGFNQFQVEGVKELVLYPLVKIGNVNSERWGRMHAALSRSGLLTGTFNAEDLIFDPVRRRAENLRSYFYIALGIVAFAVMTTLLVFIWSRALQRRANLITRELSESEARLSAIFDSAPFILALKDVDGNYTYSNQKFRHGVKQTHETLQALHARDIYDPELLPLMEEMDQEVLRTGQPVYREMILGEKFDPPGTREVIKFPVLDKVERVSGIGIISIDITARKLAESALIESENRFKDFARAASDILWELDADMRLTYISDRYAELTGRPIEFLLGKVPPEIADVPADDETAGYQRKLNQRVPFRDYVFEKIRPDGTHIFFSSSGIPVYSPENGFEGFRGTLRDISELKRTSEYLKLISTAFDSIAEVVAIYDANDILIYVNQALKSLDADIPQINQLGITFDQRMQLLADNVLGLDGADKEAWLTARTEQHRNPGAPFEFSRTPGRTFLFHEQRLPDGSTFNIGHDISAQKKATEEMRISEERFRATFENNALGNIVINAHGIIEAVNTAAETTFGYSSRELIGENVSILMSEPDRSAHNGYLQKFIETGEANIIGIGRDIVALRKNGDRFHARLGVGEMMVDGRKSFLGSIADMTTIKEMETQIIHFNKMEAIGQLTGGVAHDFNNLLSATMANAQLLELSLNGHEDLQIMASEIVKAARRGAELTHRLLAFSRKQTLQPKSLNLNELCQSMLDMLQRSLGENIEIELVPSQFLWNVLADPGQVENALLNLAINARDAMPDGGKLTITMENKLLSKEQMDMISTTESNAFVCLAVTDTGTGIPTEVLHQVFDPFFTTKEVGKGSGLGLSMVYGFAQQSGGFANIESITGEGTSVSIFLRKSDPEQVYEKDGIFDAELHRGQGETILLVEDNEIVMQAITAMLKILGYTVRTAENGDMALDIARQPGNIDLLLTDIVLPGNMNGIELSQEIRADNPDLKCLFMSGYAALPNYQIPKNEQLVDKPFEIESIAIKLKEILR